jgi:hypothetical protein
MKKIMSIALGLGLVLGSVSFAQTAPAKPTKAKATKAKATKAPKATKAKSTTKM